MSPNCQGITRAHPNRRSLGYTQDCHRLHVLAERNGQTHRYKQDKDNIEDFLASIVVGDSVPRQASPDAHALDSLRNHRDGDDLTHVLEWMLASRKMALVDLPEWLPKRTLPFVSGDKGTQRCCAYATSC